MKYKKFRIDEIFTAYDKGGKYFRKRDIQPAPDKLKDPVAVVQSSYKNAGTLGYIERKDAPAAVLNDLITVAQLGQAFYQERPFLTQKGATTIRLKQEYAPFFNRYVGLYLAAVLTKRFTYFNYQNQAYWRTFRLVYINLPVNNDGDPDFAYMTNYMKKVDKIAKENLKAVEKMTA